MPTRRLLAVTVALTLLTAGCATPLDEAGHGTSAPVPPTTATTISTTETAQTPIQESSPPVTTTDAVESTAETETTGATTTGETTVAEATGSTSETRTVACADRDFGVNYAVNTTYVGNETYNLTVTFTDTGSARTVGLEITGEGGVGGTADADRTVTMTLRPNEHEAVEIKANGGGECGWTTLAVIDTDDLQEESA